MIVNDHTFGFAAGLPKICSIGKFVMNPFFLDRVLGEGALERGSCGLGF